jgi:hypothetical protein
MAIKTSRSQAQGALFAEYSALSARGKDCVSHEASRLAVIEPPNTAGEIMTKNVVSVLAGSSVRDVAILLLEKRISAVPVLAANLELLGMVSEGDLLGRSDTDRVARRDWWLTLLKNVQPQTETIAALAARAVEQGTRPSLPSRLGPRCMRSQRC